MRRAKHVIPWLVVLCLCGATACISLVEPAECEGHNCGSMKDCSGHGTCRLQSGEPVCICNHGYQGANCGECIAGYDRQPDDFCLPTIGVQIQPREPFQMGSLAEELGHNADEAQHEVTLTRDFEIMDHEVTQGEFESVMGWNPSHFGPQGSGSECGADCPVETVSWFDAVAYARQLSEQVGLDPCYDLSNVQCEHGGAVGSDYMRCFDDDASHGGIGSADITLRGGSIYQCKAYRLPTEAEWEYAARGLNTLATHNGNLASGQLDCEQPNTALDSIAWFCGNSAESVQPVGDKISNFYKLYDMSGNVQEWVWDWYAP